MDDLSAMLSQIMSDPEAMKQIRDVASSLGIGGQDTGAVPPQLPATGQNRPQTNQTNPGGGLDLSALAALLQSQNNNPPPVPQNNTPDISALASLLGGLNNQPAPPAPQNNSQDLSALAALLGNINLQNQQPKQAAVPDISAMSGLLGNLAGGNQQTAGDGGGNNLSALTSLLNGGNPPAQNPAGILPNIDINTIMKISSALSSLQANKANVDLLLALKPRLKEERGKKVDDAIRVMQLIQFLPLLKESGLFGEMDNILGGLSNIVGGPGGGIGGLLSGVGNGLGGLLGSLGLSGGRR